MKSCTKCPKYKTCTELCEKVEECADQDHVMPRKQDVYLSDMSEKQKAGLCTNIKGETIRRDMKTKKRLRDIQNIDLSVLTGKQRKVIVWNILEEKTYAWIAKKLKITASGVRYIKKEALTKLRLTHR